MPISIADTDRNVIQNRFSSHISDSMEVGEEHFQRPMVTAQHLDATSDSDTSSSYDVTDGSVGNSGEKLLGLYGLNSKFI